MAHGYHHGDLRAALVAAALRALDREGALPSWRALAQSCGVSHAAPYRHFESLEALRAAVMQEVFRRFSNDLARAARGVPDPRRALEERIRGYVRFAQRHPHWYGLAFGRPIDARRYPDADRASREAFGILVEAVRACGVPRPSGISFVLWAAMHGLADLFLRGLPEVVAADKLLIDGLIRMSLDYLDSVRGEPCWA